jgi:hypothetical protein
MGVRFPYYLLADSPVGRQKEAEITRTAPSTASTRRDVRQGFVYDRVPNVTLNSVANNAEIDVIWDKHQPTLEQLRTELNAALKQSWQEWEIPREADPAWSSETEALHGEWWQQRVRRQQEIDASIAAKPQGKRPASATGEWSDVVDAWHLRSWEAYRDVARRGRKTRVGGRQRELLWAIFEQVRQGVAARKAVT